MSVDRKCPVHPESAMPNFSRCVGVWVGVEMLRSAGVLLGEFCVVLLLACISQVEGDDNLYLLYCLPPLLSSLVAVVS